MKPNKSYTTRMMTKWIPYILIVCMLWVNPLFGSNGGDFFTNIGKIYVVVGVILLVFLGLIFFLLRLENRIKKLEEEISKN